MTALAGKATSMRLKVEGVFRLLSPRTPSQEWTLSLALSEVVDPAIHRVLAVIVGLGFWGGSSSCSS
jgi:hypothetical protein